MCVMYVDDIIILSRSSEGLEKLLDLTNIYCNKWKMTVNKSKTKCMTFSSKKKEKHKGFICNWLMSSRKC